MTGFEHTAAAHLLYEGREDDGLRVIAALRARYDGRRRSPFDEAECGHHYARAMAAWAHVLSPDRLRVTMPCPDAALSPRADERRWFWSTG
jgi:hypothetical protein